jgi:hypothetical protein
MVVSKLTPRSVKKLSMLNSIVNQIKSLETLNHSARRTERACKFKAERSRFLGNISPDRGNSYLATPEHDAGYGVLPVGTGTE